MYLFDYLITDNFFENFLFKVAVKFFLYLGFFETAMTCTMIIYVCSSLSITIKLCLVHQITYFLNTLIQFTLYSNRPYQSYNKINMPECVLSWGMPSTTIYTILFFYSYMFILYFKNNNYNHKKSFNTANKDYTISVTNKLFTLFIILIATIGASAVLVLAMINYFCQITYTIILNIIILSVILDLDKVIDEFIINRIREIGNFRTFKMLIYAISVCLILLTYILFNSSLKVYNTLQTNNLLQIPSCKGILWKQGSFDSFNSFSTIMSINGLLVGCSISNDDLDYIHNINMGYFARFLQYVIIICSSFAFFFPWSYTNYLAQHEVVFILASFKHFIYSFLFSWLLPKFFRRILKNKILIRAE